MKTYIFRFNDGGHAVATATDLRGALSKLTPEEQEKVVMFVRMAGSEVRYLQ